MFKLQYLMKQSQSNLMWITIIDCLENEEKTMILYDYGDGHVRDTIMFCCFVIEGILTYSLKKIFYDVCLFIK